MKTLLLLILLVMPAYAPVHQEPRPYVLTASLWGQVATYQLDACSEEGAKKRLEYFYTGIKVISAKPLP